MIIFEVVEPVIYHFDLFLNDRHTLSKIVMSSYLSGKLLDLGIRYRLSDLKVFVGFVVRKKDRNNGPDQR